MKFDHQMFISLYNAQPQYGALDDSQASGMDTLLSFLEQDADISDVRWAAYMLATVKEECADTWQPIEEIGKGQGLPYGNPVTVTDPNGNTYVNTYYGGGYPQLTGEDSYQQMGQNLNLGDQLLYHPELALDPPTSYNVMSYGMRNGSFTGVSLGDFINDSQTDYVDARRIINGLDNTETIAAYATTLESLLRQSSAGEGPGPRQYHIVNAPSGVNARKGPGTSFPVARLVPNGSAIDITCQVQGQIVNGTNIWNQLADGTFVSDFYCDTPYFDKFSPPIPVCQGAPQSSPVPPDIKGDDYPFPDAPVPPLYMEMVDYWNFYCRECTSFVAWRMNQLGVDFTNGMSGPNGPPPDGDPVYGNGEHWAAHAQTLGFLVDNTPSVGAIAHYDPNVSGAGDLGHVAYVAQVNGDGTIVIEEYNWAPAYGYSNPPRVIPASDVTSFIHIVS
jgi:putative chitinase